MLVCVDYGGSIILEGLYAPATKDVSEDGGVCVWALRPPLPCGSIGLGLAVTLWRPVLRRRDIRAGRQCNILLQP